ncbi:MAG: hypothetical protein ACRDT6_27010 [Micromonosporaceae bacterium]
MEGTGKLVRDRIPELIRADGGEPQTRTAHDAEYPSLLRLKLLEEVQEYLDSEQPDELVDVIEVVHALARTKGVSPERLEELRAAKHTERGGFEAQTVLVTTAEDMPPPNGGGQPDRVVAGAVTDEDADPPGPLTASRSEAPPRPEAASRPAGAGRRTAMRSGLAAADYPMDGPAEDSEAPTVENPVPARPPSPTPRR